MGVVVENNQTAQNRFNERYITSAEICKQLGVTRTSVLYARRRGKLPNSISLCGHENGICFWEREEVKPALAAWQSELNQRKGIL